MWTLSKPSLPQTTADTGMDVLTHAVESYVSPMSGTYAEALAEKAVRLVFSDLLTAYHSPDDTRARAHMHAASNLAGFAFDYTSLGINHGIAHAVGGVFHIPHGRCNAVLLPHVIAYNAKKQPVRIRQIYRPFPVCWNWARPPTTRR